MVLNMSVRRRATCLHKADRRMSADLRCSDNSNRFFVSRSEEAIGKTKNGGAAIF